MKTITELKYRQCRWPIARTDQHYFCGEVTDGRSYCHAHCRVAYDKSPDRNLALLEKGRGVWR